MKIDLLSRAQLSIINLHDPDFPGIIKEMNRTPMGSLGYHYPIEALFDICPPIANLQSIDLPKF